MATSTSILVVRGSTATFAVATVLSTLVGMDKLVLKNERVGEPSRLPKRPVLVINEKQIGSLAGLRLRGFSGPVLILSLDSFESLREKHGILRWGQGSHDACGYPWTLPGLLAKLSELAPLEAENLKVLQSELEAPNRLWRRRVIPCLRRLRKRNSDLLHELDAIAEIVEELRARTPVTCHAVVEIRGRRAQIQEHFRILVEEIRSSHDRDDKQLATLQEVFEQWRTLVLDAGEGIGAFS